MRTDVLYLFEFIDCLLSLPIEFVTAFSFILHQYWATNVVVATPPDFLFYFQLINLYSSYSNAKQEYLLGDIADVKLAHHQDVGVVGFVQVFNF